MQNKDIARRARDYGIGAVGGLALAALFGFGSGWLTTHARMTHAVDEAMIGSFAAVCADEAMDYWKAQKKDLAALRSQGAWDTREKLAKQFAAELPQPQVKDIADRVVMRCAADMSLI